MVGPIWGKQTVFAAEASVPPSGQSIVGASPRPVVQAFFSPTASDDTRGTYHNLMRFLDTAQQSIHGSAHEVDMISVAEKLAQKAAEGVDVQIVVEARWWSLQKNTAARMVLEKSKVRIIPDTKKSGLQHNKFFVADGIRVWTGSTNLTETCLFYNPNNSLWIEDAEVAKNYQTEFNEQVAGGFGKKGSGAPNTPHPVVVNGDTKITTFFSPEDESLDHVVKLIQSARKSIDVMCFVFSSEEMTRALLEAHARGVKIRVLLDNGFSSDGMLSRWRFVPYRTLTQAGVECRYDDEKSKLHHKVIIVDGRSVLTGSMNLSTNGIKNNDENSIIVDDAVVGRDFQEEFDRLWTYFQAGNHEIGPGEMTDSEMKAEMAAEAGQ
ncbi:MAG: phospholipase D-like domain-containing protein [Verrucomicrobiae bacterium]|nr:phospholipase D-like domain-containing protein [Verrucomicrobiae bacterium]